MTVGLLGVSIGKPYFSNKKNMKFYTEYLKTNFDSQVILLADEPKRHNYNAISPGMSGRLIDKKIRKQVESLTGLIRKFDKDVEILTWADARDENYISNLKLLREEYVQNSEFQNDINTFVCEFLENFEFREINSAIHSCKNYVLEEVAMLNSIQCRFSEPVVEIYPGELIIQEIAGEKYPNLSKLRNDSRRVFREVYAPE